MSWIFHVIAPEKTTGNFASHWLEYLLSTWWLRFLQHFSDEGCHLHLHDSGYPEHVKSSIFSAQVYSSSSQKTISKGGQSSASHAILNQLNFCIINSSFQQHMAALAFSERNGRCSSASWSNHASTTSSAIRPGSKLEDHPKNGHSLHVFC